MMNVEDLTKYKANDNQQGKKKDRDMNATKEQYTNSMDAAEAALIVFRSLKKGFADENSSREEHGIAQVLELVGLMATKYHEICKVNYRNVFGEEYHGRFGGDYQQSAAGERADAGASVSEVGSGSGEDQGGQGTESAGLGGVAREGA